MSHSLMSHIAIPLTGFFIGTHPDINARVDPHTEAIEVEPPAPSTSETTLIVYGKSASSGSIGSIDFSASLPCPISRLFVNLIIRASLFENGGIL